MPPYQENEVVPVRKEALFAIGQVVEDLQKRALNISLVLWGIFAFGPSFIIAGYETRSGWSHLFG